MNIQPSVIIWTVVCFTLLMLILRNGVFKPVLKTLDKRRGRLDAARAKKADYSRRERELEESLVKAEAAMAEEKANRVKAAVAAIQADEKNRAKLAQRKCLEELEAYREELGRDRDGIIKTVGPQMKEVADIFAQKITSDKA